MLGFAKTAVVLACKVVAVAACGFISLFVLASGYESIYNRSLPYVHTLDSVNLTAVAGTYDLAAFAKPDLDMYGKFGKPTTLKFATKDSNSRLDVGPAVYEDKDGQWLARTTSLHSIIPVEPRKGNIGLLMLYCRSSFRTVSAAKFPAGGDNIFVDTDQQWRYVYKVTNARLYNQGDTYVPSASGSQATGKLLIMCNDPETRVNTIVEADLLSVQGTEQ